MPTAAERLRESLEPQGSAADRLRRSLEPEQPAESGGVFGNLLPTQEGRDFLAESVQAVPEFVTGFAQDKARAVKTYWQNLARFAGMDVPEPTPEDQEHFRSALVEGLSTIGGAGAGRAVSTGAQAMTRGLMRGGSKAGTERWLLDQSRHVVPEGARATASMARELVRPVAVGAATKMAIDWNDPGTNEFWDELIALPIGLGAGGVASQEARANLLLQHPRFRAAATRASRAGVPAQIIGGLAGYYLSQLYPEGGEQ